jgi:SagB-type dehydrogenase family enzyme
MKNIFGPSTSLAVSIEAALKAHVSGNVDLVEDSADIVTIPEAWVLRNRKLYPRFPKILLPRAESNLKSKSIAQLLSQRMSNRTFENKPITLTLLGGILDASVSVIDQEAEYGRRPVPSAGARYPVEVYIIALNVTGLSAGVYHYDPYEHFLEHMFEGFDEVNISDLVAGQAVENPAVLIVLTGILHRTLVKYGGRGYRFVLLEAGGVAQEIDLACRAAGIGSVWLGGFCDRLVAGMLDINQRLEMEFPLLMIAAGILAALDREMPASEVVREELRTFLEIADD